jgi:hypothetical protein
LAATPILAKGATLLTGLGWLNQPMGGGLATPRQKKKKKRNKNSRVLRATPKGYKGGSATPKGYRGGSATLNGQNDSIFSFSFFVIG